MAPLPIVEIFTDGSCEGNPGPGGWAALIRSDGKERELSGSERQSTNNRMELTAALKALQSLKHNSRVQLYTDSQYLRKGITEWLAGWEGRGWKRRTGVLANVDLWQALAEEIKRHEINWRWVRGHVGHKENDRVDRLARKAALSRS